MKQRLVASYLSRRGTCLTSFVAALVLAGAAVSVGAVEPVQRIQPVNPLTAEEFCQNQFFARVAACPTTPGYCAPGFPGCSDPQPDAACVATAQSKWANCMARGGPRLKPNY
jgi:hypothetical protein